MTALYTLLSKTPLMSLLVCSAAAALAFAQLLLAAALAHLARDGAYLRIGLVGALLSAAVAWIASRAPEPLQLPFASIVLLGCFAAPVTILLKKARIALDPLRVRHLRAQLDEKELQLLRRDVERAATRSSAEQTKHRQHEFLAAMSHELRTPLAGIVGLSRMLAASSAAGQFTRDMGTIERFAQQLLRTVDEGLAFVRQEPPPEKPAVTLVHMSLLLRDIHVLSTWLAKQQGNSFALINSSPMPEALYFDEQKLRQVMVNLVSNAAKYCEKGHIGIAVALEKRAGKATQLVWVVHDSGRGMDKAEQRRFMEPFAKSADSIGLGLGLALVRRLVRQLGGRLTIWSERGKGTQIRMRMPVAVAEAEALSVMDIGSPVSPSPGGDSIVFATVPSPYPGVARPSGLPAQDLARLDLGIVREYVKLGQITRIEQWTQRLRHEPDLSRETRQFLERMALATATIDLQRVEELIDEAAAPLRFHHS